MTLDEFGTQISRLIKVYGEKAYPEERTAQIYKKVKWRHVRVFEDAIDFLIGDSSHAPMLGKIMESCFSSQRKFPELEVDPYKDLRDKIRDAQKQNHNCYRCSGAGAFMVYRKYEGLAMRVLICRCDMGPIAKQLPDYRAERFYEAHDPFYLIMDFDPNKSEKFKLYQDLYFENTIEAQPKLAEIYYEHEIKMTPCYWYPPSWDHSARKYTSEPEQIEKTDINTLVKKLALEKRIEP